MRQGLVLEGHLKGKVRACYRDIMEVTVRDTSQDDAGWLTWISREEYANADDLTVRVECLYHTSLWTTEGPHHFWVLEENRDATAAQLIQMLVKLATKDE